MKTVKKAVSKAILLTGLFAAGCKFGEAAPPPEAAVEGSNVKIEITVTHAEGDSSEYYNFYKDKYIYIEGYYNENRGKSGAESSAEEQTPKIEGFVDASFKSGMILPKTTHGTTDDTVTIPLYLRIDYDDLSRKYTKFTYDPSITIIYFWIWYFYYDTMWDKFVPPVGRHGPFTVSFNKIADTEPNPTPVDPEAPVDFTKYNYSGAYSFNVNSIIPYDPEEYAW
ncbi:MAG: hypothetical protein LBG72_03985 [Spirochaetaceae bacterium]|nr:hypothetical protein [Spirochaetaceae bacterium]